MSIWIIERVMLIGTPVTLALVPFSYEVKAKYKVEALKRIYGGDYRVVEYRRVDR